MTNIKLSIVIPVHNNHHFTRACLKDLRQLPEDHQVVLVDNGSNPSAQMDCGIVRSGNEQLVYIRNDDNRGFAFACNQGHAAAKGEYVMFLNNDIRVRQDHQTWTQPIIVAAQDGSLVGPTGGLLDKNLKFVKEENKLHDSKYFYMSGWCLTAQKEIWDKLKIDNYQGPFTEELTSYFEDTDLSFRARELGIPFKIVPVPVTHFGRMTGKQLGLQQLYASAHTKFINKWVNRI